MYTNSAMLEAINECVHDERHREALKRKLIDGWTYERVAEQIDRTPRQTYSIVKRYLPALREYLSQ